MHALDAGARSTEFVRALSAALGDAQFQSLSETLGRRDERDAVARALRG